MECVSVNGTRKGEKRFIDGDEHHCRHCVDQNPFILPQNA